MSSFNGIEFSVIIPSVFCCFLQMDKVKSEYFVCLNEHLVHFEISFYFAVCFCGSLKL